MLNALFPTKLFVILGILENCSKWIHAQRATKDIPCEYPDLVRTRVLLCSPQVLVAVRNITKEDYIRVRFAYINKFSELRKASVEVYASNGKLLCSLEQQSWSFELSLAVETEMLEMLLNINPM